MFTITTPELTTDATLEVLDCVRVAASTRGFTADADACELVSRFITTREVERLELQREVEHLRRDLSLLRQRLDGGTYVIPAVPVRGRH